MNTVFANQTIKKYPIKLYRNPLSGHCHRVELMLSLLDLPYETIDVDMLNGEHKFKAFLKLYFFGQVPVIDDNDNDNSTILSDANSILIYLVKTYNSPTHWYSEDPSEFALMQRWPSVAAGEVAHGPAAARLVKLFGANLDHSITVSRSHTLFKTLDTFLTGKKSLVSETYSIADIACYSYIAHAPEGGISLKQDPNIERWLEGIERLKGFVGMSRSASFAD